MSCLPEVVYSVYIDGELPPDEVRRVETHLVGCEPCRRSILALQEEAALLRDVVKDHIVVAPVAPARHRARGLVFGLGPALVLAALAFSVVGWVLEQRMPQGVSWMNPLSFFGAYDMFFDFVFMARDRAPALLDLGVAVGATAGFAGLLTFVGTALLRRLTGVGTLAMLAVSLLLATGAVAPPAVALEVRTDDRHVTVGAEEVLEETLLSSAESVTLLGVVEGDVVLLAERIDIRGTVRGNVIAVGRDVVLTGRVDGALLVVCEVCSIEGEVTRNFYVGAERLDVQSSGNIGRDAFLFGDRLRMDGSVGRDLFAGAGALELYGSVGRNVDTRTDRLEILETASIGGALDIKTPPGHEDRVDVSPDAKIAGETTTGVLEHPIPDPSTRFTRPSFYMRALVLVASAFLVGMALYTLFPRLFAFRLETSGDFARCLGYGFVALVVTPLVLLFCFITVVGIPIGLIGVFVYLTTLFVSMIVIAALIGTSLTGGQPTTLHGFGTALLLGLVIVAVAVNLPYLGGPLRVLVGLSGMGLLIITAVDAWREGRVARV